MLNVPEVEMLDAVIAELLDNPAHVNAPAREMEPVSREPVTLSEPVVIELADTVPVAVRPAEVRAPPMLTLPVDRIDVAVMG